MDREGATGDKPRYLQVRNWDKFQHYKDRQPSWIKLYVELLDDWDFLELSEAQQAQLVKLWLLAARCDNKIPYDQKYLRRKLGGSRIQIEPLLELGFIEPWDGTEETWGKRPSRYIPGNVRDFVFTRGGEVCAECESSRYLEIDHIVPISRGGTSDVDNLQVLCRSCNRRKRTRVAESAEQNGTQTPQVATQLRSLETEESRKDKGLTEASYAVNGLSQFPVPESARAH